MTLRLLKHLYAYDQIAFHPHAQNRLFSSSTDGLVCMFDTTQSVEDESLISGMKLHRFAARLITKSTTHDSVTPTDKAVEVLGFFGDKGSLMYVVSSDQTMALYNIEQNEEIGKLDDVRQALSGVVAIDYVVDCQFDATSNSLYMLTGTFGYPCSRSSCRW